MDYESMLSHILVFILGVILGGGFIFICASIAIHNAWWSKIGKHQEELRDKIARNTVTLGR